MDILIVDDDAAVRRVHQRLLEKAGYMVTAVDNGLAALAEIQQRPYRAILCDVQMPFLKGNSFYQELLENYPEMAQRLIFITGFADDEEVAAFLKTTGRPVLRKPANSKTLIPEVRKVSGH